MGKNRLEAFRYGVFPSLLFGIATVRYGAEADTASLVLGTIVSNRPEAAIVISLGVKRSN